MASTWNTAQSGQWNVSGDWSGGIPNAANAVANFTTLGAFVSPWTIDLAGVTETVGTLNVSASLIEHYDFDNGVLAMKITSLTRGATAAINVTSAGNSSFSALDSSLTLNLLSNTTIDNVTAGQFDVAAKITGAGQLIATGLGTVRIDNSANNWTGGLVVSGGTVLTFAANALAGGKLDVAAASAVLDLNGYNQSVGNLSGIGIIQTLSGNATLTVNETANTTFSGMFEDGSYGNPSSVALNLTKAGAGTLTLAGENLTQGAITINQGAISLGYKYALPIYGSVAVAAGAKLDLAGYDTQIRSVSGAGSIVNSGPGVHFLQLTGSSAFGGSISGAISVQMDYASTSLTLSGANAYTGSTFIDGGTLKAGADNAFSAASAYFIDPQSTIDLNGFNETITALTGTGKITNGASASTSSVVTFQTNGVTISTASIVDGAAGGVIGLDVAGAGQLVLAGANTYSGATTIEAGATLVAGANNALSANSVIDVKAGGALDLAGYDEAVGGLTDAGPVSSSVAGNVTLTVGSSTFGGAITDGGGVVGLTVAAGAAFHMSGHLSAYSGATTIGVGAKLYSDTYNALSANSSVHVSSGGSLILGDYPQEIGGLSGAGTVAHVGFTYATLTVDESLSSTFSGQINSGLAGSGVNLDKIGAGTLTLAGDNSQAGDMIVETGTLSAGAASAFTLAHAVIISAGGTLDLGGYDQTIGNLDSNFNGGGIVANSGAASATLTINGTQSTFSGAVKDGAGVVGLSLAATAVVGLSGANTYSGLTKIGAGAKLSTGATNALSAASALSIGLTGVLDLKGYSQVAGAISGTGIITNSASSPSSVVLTTKTSGVTTYSGTIVDGAGGGSIGLDVAGAGKLVLAGANTYSGSTTIEAGATLGAGANNALSANSIFNVKGGGTLDLASFNETIGGLTVSGVVSGAGALTLTGNSTIQTGANLTVAKLSESGAGATLAVNTLITYAGALTEASGTISIASGDKLGLTGTNTLSGAVTGAGKLAILGGVTTLNAGAAVSVANLAVNGAAATLALGTVGIFNYAGALTETAGTITIASGDKLGLTGADSLSAAVTGAGKLAILGGVTTLNAGATLSVANLALNGAGATLALGTVGTLNYAGALSETNGTISIASGDKLALTGVSSLSGAVTGAGKLAILGGVTTLNAGAALSVASLAVNGAGATLALGAVGTLNYAGALAETAGTISIASGDKLGLTGADSLSGAVTGAGKLAILGGVTTLNAGAALSVANLALNGAGATLALGTVGALGYAGVLSETNGTISIAIGDKLSLTGTDSFSGVVSGLGELAIMGGAASILSGANLAVSSLSISGAATTVTLDENLTYAGAFSLLGGTLDLEAGQLTLSGVDNLTGGAVKGSHILLTQGTTTTASNFTLGGAAEWENTTTVNQTGAVMIGDANGNAAFLDNTATGVYNLAGDVNLMQGTSPASHIANAGVIKKSSGTGLSTIQPAVTNTGTIKVKTGALEFIGAVTGVGSDMISDASTLQFDSTVAAGQTISFTGSGGTLDLGSPQGFSGAITGFDLGGASNDALVIASGWTFTGATHGATSTSLGFINGAAHSALTLQGDYTGTFNQTAIMGGTKITYAG